MEKEKTNEKSQGLSKVLGPMHIWALGVGIVLVGEFMGWNFTVAKGGSIGSVIALWTVAMLYVMIVMMNTEMGSVMPEAGGQYTMAKYMLGPLAAFNVGLMLVLEYAMLEAADVLVVGQILESLNPNVKALPFIILSLLVLTYMNYRGVYATLTLNFVITAVAFVTIFILLFSTSFYDPQMTLINLKKMTDGLPYGLVFPGNRRRSTGGRRMQVYQQSSATGNYDRSVRAADWCYYNMVCVLRSCPGRKAW